MAYVEVFFKWIAPLGIGPGYFIQNYSVNIVSETESYSYNFASAVTTLNASLNYNVNYTASVVAINCAGESDPLVLSNIFYGKLDKSASCDIVINYE